MATEISRRNIKEYRLCRALRRTLGESLGRTHSLLFVDKQKKHLQLSLIQLRFVPSFWSIIAGSDRSGGARRFGYAPNNVLARPYVFPTLYPTSKLYRSSCTYKRKTGMMRRNLLRMRTPPASSILYSTSVLT